MFLFVFFLSFFYSPNRISPKLPAPIRFPTRKFGPTISIVFAPEPLVNTAEVDAVVVSLDFSVVIKLFVAKPAPRAPVRRSLGIIDIVDACGAAPDR